MKTKEFVHIVMVLNDTQTKHGCIPDFVITKLVLETKFSDKVIRSFRDEVQKTWWEMKNLTSPTE